MGADGGRAVREVFCRTKPMMLSRLFSWFPRHIVPCTSGRWRRGEFSEEADGYSIGRFATWSQSPCSIAKRGAWTGAAYQPAKRCPILETGLRVGGPGSAHAFEQTKPNLLILHNLDPETPEYVDLSALRAREHPLNSIVSRGEIRAGQTRASLEGRCFVIRPQKKQMGRDHEVHRSLVLAGDFLLFGCKSLMDSSLR